MNCALCTSTPLSISAEKYTPGERTSCETTTRSEPLMMKVPRVGHEREVAHEDELLLHLARLLVDKAHVNEKRCLVGDVLGAALGDGVGRVAKLVVAKDDLHGVRGVLDRGELGKGLGKTLAHEALEGHLLNVDQVGQLHRGSNLAKGLASGRALWFGKCSLCGRHQAFPPSKRVEGGNCRNVIIYRNVPRRSTKTLDLRRRF